jgi:23S rRNA (adenine2503-C2)-methyltransferase
MDCGMLPGTVNGHLQNLYDLSADELRAFLESWGEPAFRAKQVYRHLYVHLAADVAGMTDLPAVLRERLAAEACIGNLRLVQVQQGDGGLTRKAVFRLPEGETIESVLMVYPERATVCVSSQAGCPMGCVFCATAKLGFLRDLTRGQIIEQVLWAAREVRRIHADPGGELAAGAVRAGALPAALSNVVYMGMGEAFNNYEEWWGSVERLHDPAGFNMGARSFTVSTVGLVPGIRRLAEASLPVNLAISLHAADDEVRSAMMPVNKAYPIRALLEATRDYAVRTGRRVSFEYVLLEGKNDEPAQAEQLAEVLGSGPLADLRTLLHVNLIPWNPVRGAPLARSGRERVAAFQRVLRARGIPCTVRVERGGDIDAACGQLAGGSA